MGERIQAILRAALEEEVRAFLGRGKSERRRLVEVRPGYRNGYGKPRRLSLRSGTIAVRRPRLRDLEERFESQILRWRAPANPLPPNGLAKANFELALRGLLGEGEPLSPSSL